MNILYQGYPYMIEYFNPHLTVLALENYLYAFGKDNKIHSAYGLPIDPELSDCTSETWDEAFSYDFSKNPWEECCYTDQNLLMLSYLFEVASHNGAAYRLLTSSPEAIQSFFYRTCAFQMDISGALKCNQMKAPYLHRHVKALHIGLRKNLNLTSDRNVEGICFGELTLSKNQVILSRVTPDRSMTTHSSIFYPPAEVIVEKHYGESDHDYTIRLVNYHRYMWKRLSIISLGIGQINFSSATIFPGTDDLYGEYLWADPNMKMAKNLSEILGYINKYGGDL